MGKVKHVNMVFLCTVIIAIAAQFLPLLLQNYIQNMGAFTLINQVLILLPSLVYIGQKNINPFTYLRFRKLSFASIVLIVVLGYLLIPISSFINMLSMTIFKNEVTGSILAFTQENTLLTGLCILAIVPAVFEEIVYRGLFFHEYREQNVRKGMLLSALLFGFMHMNGNQFSYAFILGLIFVIIMEASDSIISTIIIHFIINGTSVLLSYLMPIMVQMLSTMEGYTHMSELDIQNSISSDVMESITVGSVFQTYGFSTLVACILAFIVLKKIAQDNNRWEHIVQLFKRNKSEEAVEDKQRLITIPLILGVIICIGVMIYIEVR